jgi:hypothetical protein
VYLLTFSNTIKKRASFWVSTTMLNVRYSDVQRKR